MARRSPENGYQLPFDFTSRPEEPVAEEVVSSGYFADFDSREPGLGRFIRSVDNDKHLQTPADAAQFLTEQIYAPFDQFTQEELVTLMLNTKNQITHAALIYRGTINAMYIRVAEVFRPALLANARAIMISHNHPSGDPTPSPEDVRFTEMCREAGQLLDVSLVDHIIVGRERWVSLKERRLGFDA